MRPPEIIDAALPEGILGYTDGVSRIWLDRELTAVDRRVVLDHELIHYVRGHRGHCIAVVEHGIDREVALGLIHLDDLGEAAAWSEHVVVIAEELDVMPETVIDRLHALTPGERAVLRARLTDAHWVA
ncbi:hypothetical protein HMPREF3159_13270 [Brachybacterium sp. HMSC06H03]|uniref:hypothetical protein n=1 Tax=Brachybacterium sp. HMSC06H03 TaxID=1581127 RepID=UPI0008A10493|nr:hypothetical protein [Brachybacterium sp. HMSC06H03]OFT48888.1 hypothetical protein HMPREF3159_13270 [Brachybacterium sp. HMSC06H03]